MRNVGITRAVKMPYAPVEETEEEGEYFAL